MEALTFRRVLVITALGLISNGCALKIVLFPVGTTRSHILFGHNFAGRLASMGHTVFIWAEKVDRLYGFGVTPENVTEYTTKFHIRLYDETVDVFTERPYSEERRMWDSWFDGWHSSCYDQYHNHMDAIQHFKEQRFDLALAHSFNQCPLMLSQLMGIDNVVLFMVGSYIQDNAAKLHAVPRSFAHIPNTELGAGDTMDFHMRMQNIVYGLFGAWIPSVSGNADLVGKECAMHRAAPNYDYPHCWSEMGKKVLGIEVNGEPLLDFPRPRWHTVSYMGDVIRPIEPVRSELTLPADWQRIVEGDDRSLGTIVFSLGSIADERYMPHSCKMAILTALSRFANYTVIWKHEGGVPEAAAHGHIHVTQWMPQAAILRHPRTRVFVTHGGYGSVLEAGAAGVPIIVMPLFMDQLANAQRAVRLGTAEVVDWRTVDAEHMTDTLRRLLYDSRYRKASAKLATMFSDRCVRSQTSVNHHIKMLIKPHFVKVYSLDLVKDVTFSAYFCLDVISVAVACAMFLTKTLL